MFCWKIPACSRRPSNHRYFIWLTINGNRSDHTQSQHSIQHILFPIVFIIQLDDNIPSALNNANQRYSCWSLLNLNNMRRGCAHTFNNWPYKFYCRRKSDSSERIVPILIGNNNWSGVKCRHTSRQLEDKIQTKHSAPPIICIYIMKFFFFLLPCSPHVYCYCRCCCCCVLIVLGCGALRFVQCLCAHNNIHIDDIIFVCKFWCCRCVAAGCGSEPRCRVLVSYGGTSHKWILFTWLYDVELPDVVYSRNCHEGIMRSINSSILWQWRRWKFALKSAHIINFQGIAMPVNLTKWQKAWRYALCTYRRTKNGSYKYANEQCLRFIGANAREIVTCVRVSHCFHRGRTNVDEMLLSAIKDSCDSWQAIFH